jgi:Ras and EF-hand domain-containing protein
MRSETSETSSSLERKRGSILGDYIVTPRREVCRDKDIVEEVDSGHSSNLRDEDNYRHSWKDRVSVILPPQPLLNVHCLASYPRSKSCDCLYQKPECRSTCKTASQTTPAEDMYIIAPNQRPDRTFKVIFIGDAGVGKSSFILRILRNEFIPVLSSTLGVDFSVQTVLVNGCIVSLQLWDTAGQERFRSITRTYFRKADGVMLLYDVSNEQSFLNVRKWVHDIEEQTDHPIPVVIVGNKTDLRDGIQETQGKSFVSSQDGCKMSLETNSTFLEVSVKNGDGVSSALVSLIRSDLSKWILVQSIY